MSSHGSIAHASLYASKVNLNNEEALPSFIDPFGVLANDNTRR